MAKKGFEKIAKRYDYYIALFELIFLKKWRKRLLENVKGNVLEIGIGTGKNLPYYKNCNLAGIDISPTMIEITKKYAKKLNINCNIKVMSAEKLKFKDNQFNYVISSLILCDIPNPIKALKEMKRVLKKNGELRMIEHMKSNKNFIYNLQIYLNNTNKKIFGCDLLRDTEGNIKKAGFKIIKVKNIFLGDMFRVIIAKK